MAMLSYANTGVRYDIQQSLLFSNCADQRQYRNHGAFSVFGMRTVRDSTIRSVSNTRLRAYTATLFNEYIRNNVWMSNYNLSLSPYFGALLLDTPGGSSRHLFIMFTICIGISSGRVTLGPPPVPTYATEQMGVCWRTGCSIPGYHREQRRGGKHLPGGCKSRP